VDGLGWVGREVSELRCAEVRRVAHTQDRSGEVVVAGWARRKIVLISICKMCPRSGEPG